MNAFLEQIGRTTDVVASLAALDVQLPVSVDPDNFGVIQDAQGREVATIDVHAERPEEQIDAIVASLVALINASGGFAVETPTSGPSNNDEPSDGLMEPILLKHRAWAILADLKSLSSGKANEPLLHDRLEAYGLVCGRKKFRSALGLLVERGFVQIEEAGPVRVVVLTRAGADHDNRIWRIGRTL